MRQVEVDIWHGELDLKPADCGYFSAFLDKTELEYANRINNQIVRLRFLETRARLRMILSHYLNQPADSLRLCKAEHGKPYLPDFPELAFNLSHTGNYLALAVTRNAEIGLDIEQPRPRKNLSGLAEKCFAGNELSYWRQLPESSRLSTFFRFWTAKEAFVKATGRGIGLGLNQCAVDYETWTGFLTVPEDYSPASAWFLRCFGLTDSVCGAIAIKDVHLENLGQLSITSLPLFML